MQRRGYLRGLAGGGVAAGLAGCLGVLGGGAGRHTYLPKSAMAKKVDSAALPYPAWGQPLPTVTLPDPLTGDPVTTTGFEGERNVLLTCFYSHCPEPSPHNSAICREMVGVMRNIQADGEAHGYGDKLAFLAITFDPARDTAARLRTYAGQEHIDLHAGNWYFMRPRDAQQAEAVVDGDFGVKFIRTTATPATTGTATTTTGSATTGSTAAGPATPPAAATDAKTPTSTSSPATPDVSTAAGTYTYQHAAMLFLANLDGYVERAYVFESRGNPPWQDRRDDVKRLIAKEG